MFFTFRKLKEIFNSEETNEPSRIEHFREAFSQESAVQKRSELKERRDSMIRVVRLNGEELFINYFQILFLERIPETKIKLINGDFYLVKDSVESIIEQSQRFLHDALTFQNKDSEAKGQ